MKKVLFINSCVRINSRTLFLSKLLLNRFPENEYTVETVQLESEGIQPLGKKTLQMRDSYVREGDYSSLLFEYARQFAEADYIIIAAPYWDLSFPSSLKNYIETVTVPGITFRDAAGSGREGMCRCRKLFYVTASSRPISDLSYGYGYIDAMCREFYGIPETVLIKADGMDMPEKRMEEVLHKVREEIADLEI